MNLASRVPPVLLAVLAPLVLLGLASLAWGYYVAYYAVIFALASMIFRDARGRGSLALNLGPIWWALLVCIDPALGVLAYWVMNVLTLPASLRGDP